MGSVREDARVCVGVKEIRLICFSSSLGFRSLRFLVSDTVLKEIRLVNIGDD